MKQTNRIIIADNFNSEEIIYSKRIIDGKDRLKINIGTDSKSTIVIEIEGKKDSQSEIIISLGENSHANIAILSTGKKITMNRTATLEESSELNLYTYDSDTKESTSHNLINLKGNNSKASTKSLYYSEKGEAYMSSTIAIHEGRNTESLLTTKGTLNDSKSTMKGLIRIKESAKNSNGYQKNDTLIIGNGQAISVPDLEIHNNDVRCTHGSTITHLDEEKLFYMQSRGYTEEQSRNYIIQGFYEDALKDTEEKLKSMLLIKIQQKTGVQNE